MCRKKDRRTGGCELLDADTSNWNRSALLPRNAAVVAGFEHFQRAIRFAADGRLVDARTELGQIDQAFLQDWYVRHAQVAGIRRVEILKTRGAERASGPRVKLKYPSPNAEARIFERDRYTCGYCSGRVVSGRLLRSFSAAIGSDAFPMGKTNAGTHGAALVYRAVADHVVPHWLGGTTDEANLVTACYPCNFGKAEFSLKQVGLEEPRRGATAGWDGLESLIPALKSQSGVGC